MTNRPTNSVYEVSFISVQSTYKQCHRFEFPTRWNIGLVINIHEEWATQSLLWWLNFICFECCHLDLWKIVFAWIYVVLYLYRDYCGQQGKMWWYYFLKLRCIFCTYCKFLIYAQLLVFIEEKYKELVVITLLCCGTILLSIHTRYDVYC